MVSDRIKTQRLFARLSVQPRIAFPEERQMLDAPRAHGVYVIRKGKMVLHVGRTTRGQNGLHQRLSNHLHGLSSFTKKYYKGSGSKLRKAHTYQYLQVDNRRLRALLEAYATGMLCPNHLGLGV